MRFEFVNNKDINDTFEIVSNSLENANQQALTHLGYTINPTDSQEEGLTVYECTHSIEIKSFNLSSESPEDAVKTAISELGWDVLT